MSAILEKVEREVLSLPEAERAFLADRLLSSLGGEVLSDVDSAWIVESERRYSEFKEGKRIPIPAGKVFAEAERIGR